MLAVAASFVAFSIYRHAGQGRADRRAAWLFLAAVCGAFGLWSAHLVALLAQTLDVAVRFELLLTLASLFCIVFFMGAGFSIASRGGGWHAPLGGAVNGVGMGFMHYVGMAALAIPGGLEWDLPLVLVSLLLGTGLSTASLIVYRLFSGNLAIWLAAGLLVLAFAGLHVTAMQAVHFASDPSIVVGAGAAHHETLTAVLAGTSLIVLLLGVVSTLIDRQSKQDSALFMQKLVDAAIEGIVVAQDGCITSVNGGIVALSGFEPQQLIGRAIVGGLLDRPVEKGGSREAFLRTSKSALVPVKVVHKDLSSEGEVYAIHDLSEQRASERELQRQYNVLQEREEELRSRNLLLDTALKHMSQGLCMYDEDERVVVCNERYATVYGLPPDAVRPGMSRREIIEMRIAQGIWAGASPEEYLSQRTAPIACVGGLLQELSDGRTISLMHVPMPGGGWVCTHEDITERRQAQVRIEHLACHDGLTDLPNRVLLREKLQEVLSLMRRGEGVAVHCLDLDRFKEVNDALGHAIGDELLQDFAVRLRHIVREGDTLARVGGDEFVIVQRSVYSPKDATDLAAEVFASLNEPFVLGDHFQIVLGTSIGIVMAPGDGDDADQLLKNGNLALYRAKQEERGRYCFFEKDMDARMRARHEMECNLRSALANCEFELDYQPLLNLKRNEISCFEALLRWRTSDGVLIGPNEFIPLAEETGLVVPIGEWALRQALAEAAKWPRHIRIAVNLSPVQFNTRNLSQVVMSALAASGVAASRLELEITESLLLQDRDTTLATLHQLRDLGVRIALDDFGTGFSSLNYLRSFPFDKLKIDRCFIAGLEEGNEESLAIVRAVARLGASLGIATVAEGVETQQQLSMARKEGVTEVQGFWIGRPQNAATVAEAYDLYRSSKSPRRANRAPRRQAGPAAAGRPDGDRREFARRRPGRHQAAGPVSIGKPLSPPHSAQLPS